DSCNWPAAYRGRYYFADNANGRLFAVTPNASRDGVVAGSRIDIGDVDPDLPVTLRTGNDGALYVAVFPAATVSRIVRIAPKAPVSCATTTTTVPTTTSTVTTSTVHTTTTTVTSSTAPVSTTTASTGPSASTTTVTATTGPSTTTTSPDPCAVLTGPALASCRIHAAGTIPHCALLSGMP